MLLSRLSTLRRSSLLPRLSSCLTSTSSRTLPRFLSSMTSSRVAWSASSSSSSSSASSSSSSSSTGVEKDKLLFTPGPLSTSLSVKQAMLHDYGSRDQTFVQLIHNMREEVLHVCNVKSDVFTMIPVQGSGTFAVEATVSSVVPRPGQGGLLVVANGAYGSRIASMAEYHGMHVEVLTYPDNEAPCLDDVARALGEDPLLTHVSVVQSETTSGIVNDVQRVGEVVHRFGRSFIVDAMSSLGALPLDLERAHVDYVISSANKCIQGVPGFAFVVARKDALAATKGNARVLSLDLHSQVVGLDSDGQFRFTPPTHTILAFKQALDELKEEGGPEARCARYQANHDLLDSRMRAMGFRPYLADHLQGPIISTYLYPNDPKWDFKTFYSRLSDMGHVIYPGKVTNAEGFRIGNIGHIFPDDIERLLTAIEQVTAEMGFDPAAE